MQTRPTLTKRTSGDLDTIGDTVLRVTGGDRADLSELLQVVHGDLVAREVEHDVLEGASAGQSDPMAPGLGRETHA